MIDEKTKAYNRAYREAHREHLKDMSRTWRENNIEYVKSKAKERREAADKEVVRLYQQQYRIRNREILNMKKRAYSKRYYLLNRDKKRVYAKAYRSSHKNEMRTLIRNWKKTNPEKFKAKERRYYLKLNLSNCKVSQRTLHAWSVQVITRQPYCSWCFTEDKLEAHHILPKAKFPQHILDVSNGRVLCDPCHIICHRQGGY